MVPFSASTLSVAGPASMFKLTPDTPARAISSVIAQLFEKARNSMDSMTNLSQQRTRASNQLEQIASLQEQLQTAGTEKRSVYLRLNSDGIHFSNHKGLLVRLGWSDGGYAKAASAIKEFSTHLKLEGADQRIGDPALRHAFEMKRFEVKNVIEHVEREMSDVQVDLNQIQERLETFKARRAAQELQDETDEAIRQAMCDIWFTQTGSEWINALLRREAGTLRPEVPFPRCQADTVLDEMHRARAVPDGVAHNVRQLFDCRPASRLARLLAQSIMDIHAMGTTYRATLLSVDELNKYVDAHQSRTPVQTSAFMSTTLMPEEASVYLDRAQHRKSHDLHRVRFKVIGEPGHLHSRERFDLVFDPGTRFKVVSYDNHGSDVSITLQEIRDRVDNPIIV